MIHKSKDYLEQIKYKSPMAKYFAHIFAEMRWSNMFPSISLLEGTGKQSIDGMKHCKSNPQVPESMK